MELKLKNFKFEIILLVLAIILQNFGTLAQQFIFGATVMGCYLFYKFIEGLCTPDRQ